jgi:hypothetical protein
MIEKFNGISKQWFKFPISQSIQAEMKTAYEAMEEFKEFNNCVTNELRLYLLKDIQSARKKVAANPNNPWLIYELCKKIYELAGIDRVDFNGATMSEKMKLIRFIVPFARLETLWEGVGEYHDSINGEMLFLSEVTPDIAGIQ